ncbi:hypothetical protein KAU33_07155 [Candidatus Dependentiae bacterium]|nr:hypothetical protein [Candidatus Dependentiae bacterium]
MDNPDFKLLIEENNSHEVDKIKDLLASNHIDFYMKPSDDMTSADYMSGKTPATDFYVSKYHFKKARLLLLNSRGNLPYGQGTAYNPEQANSAKIFVVVGVAVALFFLIGIAVMFFLFASK